METVLLCVLLKRESLSIQHSTSRQDRGLLQTQLPNKVLSSYAQVFVLDCAFFILLKTVGHLARLELYRQSDWWLLGLPLFIVLLDLFGIFSRFAWSGVAWALENLAITFETSNRGCTAFNFCLQATSTDVVAHWPVPNVNELRTVRLAFKFLPNILSKVEIFVIYREVSIETGLLLLLLILCEFGIKDFPDVVDNI